MSLGTAASCCSVVPLKQVHMVWGMHFNLCMLCLQDSTLYLQQGRCSGGGGELASCCQALAAHACCEVPPGMPRHAMYVALCGAGPATRPLLGWENGCDWIVTCSCPAVFRSLC